MAIFKINKNKNYTTMCNYHLKDMNLSLKAKGLLSVMLSLPENWDYSVRGLTEICKETKDTINSILQELETNNYLVRKRVYCNGKISDWEYNIYESNDLHPKNQDIENQDIENYDININTKELNTKEYKEENILKEERKFKKPTLEEVEEYIKENNYSVDARTFYDYFEVGNWKDSKGNQVKNWKQKLITWEKKGGHTNYNNRPSKPIPEWFDKEIKESEPEQTSEENIEQQDWLDFINDFRNQ